MIIRRRHVFNFQLFIIYFLTFGWLANAECLENHCQSDSDCQWDCGCGCHNKDSQCQDQVECENSSECYCYAKQCTDVRKISELIQKENWTALDCQERLLTVHFRNLCLKGLSILRSDYTICKQMQLYESGKPSDQVILNNLYLMASCIADVARKLGDVTICQQLSQSLIDPISLPLEDQRTFTSNVNLDYSRKWCVADIAYNLKDASTCEGAQLDEKSLCFSQVAKATSNPDLCDRIEGYQDDCFYDMAVQLNDRILCERIKRERTRDMCFQKIPSR